MSDHSRLTAVLDAIRTELVDRAEAKFPEFPTDPIHAAAIVAEEAGELIKATLQATYEGHGWGEAYNEAVETGAMALRFLVMMPFMEKRPSPQAKRPSEEARDQ